MIKREQYLSKIRGFYDNFELVKVITGLRRSGKSVLLHQIENELLEQGIKQEQITYINFEDFDYSRLSTAEELHAYLKPRLSHTTKNFIFFDEIQNVDRFELVVNSLRVAGNNSIFITGSNGKLLSGELATHLSGRYVSFRIMPFSFSEIFELLGGDSSQKDAYFQKYLEWGGMPQLYSLRTELEYRTYLEDLFNSVVYRDIIDRAKLKDPDLLDRLLQFLIENVGGVFSANSIRKFLKQDGVSAATGTIYSYLDAIEASLIVTPARRYDIRGKKVLSFFEKYYLADLGLMQLKRSDYEKSAPGRLENIVYNELLARGKKIFIGENNGREIDFITDDFGRITYYQVSQVLASREVIDREFTPLLEIRDNFPKVVLSLDKIDHSRDGIHHHNIIDWLLDKNPSNAL